MAEKPLIMSDDMSLVGHDLSSVFAHWKGNDFNFPSREVQFKKKESIDNMAKSVVKHRIQSLTGKNLPTIEADLGKPIESVQDLRRLAKLFLLEAFGKLPHKEEKKVDDQVKGRKRVLEETPETRGGEPVLKRGRKSLAATSTQRNIPTPTRSSRRSMLPSIPLQETKEMDIDDKVVEEEEEEDQIDLSDLGPNPTPQMIELKKKQKAGKKGSSTNGLAAPPLVQKSSAKSIAKRPVLPAKANFSGNKNNAVYLVAADVMDKEQNAFEYTKLQNHLGDEFKGANLTFIHSYVEWNPADVFALLMNVKLLNRKAKLDSFLVMLGCGISNIHLFREALFRHTKHVQLVVFEKQDMNKDARTNATMLRETAAIFLMAYFFPGCQDENSLPDSKMVRSGMTTVMHTNDNEDLENTVIHAFTEEEDWVFDVCCGSRELSLAAQKSGRNAVAFEADSVKLKELSEKAKQIAKTHDPTFRQGVDGKIISI